MIHINVPKYSIVKKFRNKCPDCKKRTYKIGLYQEWYGWTVTCLICGRKWGDGEWMPLGFYRNARKDTFDSAKSMWKKHNQGGTR